MKPFDVLFVGHDGGFTGAPNLLLTFQRWLCAHSQLRFATILRGHGPLVPAFAALGNTETVDEGGLGLPSLACRAARRFGLAATSSGVSRCAVRWRERAFRVIYSNTVTNGELVTALARPGVPVITHVHELNYWIERSGAKNWNSVKMHTTLFVAASEAVAHNLKQRHGIPPDKIVVVHEFIPVDLSADIQIRGQGIRAELSIPPGAFVVAGGGTEMWRKGKDLFVQLAATILRNTPERPCFFVWVGPICDAEDLRWLRHDATQAGIADRVKWVGEVTNPLDYFAACDALAMVSREDPFPLVCLEAALLRKPVVCFENAGGIPELVGSDAGFSVPYLDLPAMAVKFLTLMRDERLRSSLGAQASTKVRERFSVDVAGPRLLAIIGQLIGHTPTT